MIISNNPLGDDPADIIEKTAARRVGSRIRKIRTARGLSQSELGKKLGLSADRIQQYENGFRKPKMKLIKAFAAALDVSTLALIDPIVTADLGIMFALFEMESADNIDIVKNDYTFSVTFNNKNSTLRGFLDAWYEASCTYKEEMRNAQNEEERKAATAKYNDFKWTFPSAVSEETVRKYRELAIKEKIEVLEQELIELHGKESS